MEKSSRSSSKTKVRAERGALKAAAIPAAMPTGAMDWTRAGSLKAQRPMREVMAVLMWTVGPSRPRLLPSPT